MRGIINVIEKKLPWGLIGGLIGVSGLIVGIYYAIYYEKKAEVSFQIVNESDILDVRKPLKDLEIFFEGDDIQKENLNLRVIRLKIMNTGQVDILQDFYDTREDWGFKISNGKIIEIRPTKTNSKYLEEKINPIKINDDFIKLEKVILEREKYISFEILVLHNKDNTPRIITVGKIAGIDNFEITDSIPNEKETSLLDDLFYGKLHTHIIRFGLYFIVMIFLMVITGITLHYIGNLKEKVVIEKRKKKLERMGIHLSNNDSTLDKIYNEYLKGNFDVLKRLNNILKSNTDLKNRIDKLKIVKKYREEINQLDSTNCPDRMGNDQYDFLLYQHMIMQQNSKWGSIHDDSVNEILESLIENEGIIIEDQKIIVDKEYQHALNIIIAVIS